jgi:processing peptidase subunit alpha
MNPAFKLEELDAQRDAAYYEGREINSKPEFLLPEVLHAVAYNGRGLGNPMLCPEERIPSINSGLLKHAFREWYRPERMVIAGAGVAHQDLVELVDKYFSSLKPSTPSIQPSQVRTSTPTPPHLLSSSPPGVAKSLTRAASYLFPNSLSQTIIPTSSTSMYTGGHRFIRDPSQELNHLYVAYEGAGANDDDVYAVAIIQVLLGGGASFSAGGPGKGMYSRLYTQILNPYPQVDHCASFHHIYRDSALIGLFASFLPAASGVTGGNTPSQILPHLVHQLSLLLYSPISSTELQRAKNQLNSGLMMALESRPVEVENLGCQVYKSARSIIISCVSTPLIDFFLLQILMHGRKLPITEVTEKIEGVTAQDIRRVAAKLFSPESGSKPTVVVMGHEDLGTYKEVFSEYGLAAP